MGYDAFGVMTGSIDLLLGCSLAIFTDGAVVTAGDAGLGASGSLGRYDTISVVTGSGDFLLCCGLTVFTDGAESAAGNARFGASGSLGRYDAISVVTGSIDLLLGCGLAIFTNGAVSAAGDAGLSAGGILMGYDTIGVVAQSRALGFTALGAGLGLGAGGIRPLVLAGGSLDHRDQNQVLLLRTLIPSEIVVICSSIQGQIASFITNEAEAVCTILVDGHR